MTDEQPSNPTDPPLFENPEGIRIVGDRTGEPRPGAAPSIPIGSPAGGGMPLQGSDLSDGAPGDMDLEESERLLEGFDPEADIHRTGRGEQRTDGGSPAQLPLKAQIRIATRSPGAHFIYALIALTVALGVLGLALTWRDGRVLGACAVITPLSFTWFLIRFRSWLNKTPYWYRLLTSLGENADNLSHFRLLRWFRKALRAIYT